MVHGPIARKNFLRKFGNVCVEISVSFSEIESPRS
jgi:hypothetical protein